MQPITTPSLNKVIPQQPTFADAGIVQGNPAPPIAANQNEPLKIVSGNPIAAPTIGGKIPAPAEGSLSTPEMEDAMSRIAALMQKFAKAQDMAR